jgi:hypothetical protein
MDKYLQLNLNGFKYFVRREVMDSLYVVNNYYSELQLKSMSDYVIGSDNKIYKCREDLITILKPYLDRKPEYNMMELENEVHRCRQVQNPEKSNDDSSRKT